MENLAASLAQNLENLWAKIQQLKESDPFQAQVLYEKYKKLNSELESELPPPVPEMSTHIVIDQCTG